jgi:EB1-like C-terminal motif
MGKSSITGRGTVQSTLSSARPITSRVSTNTTTRPVVSTTSKANINNKSSAPPSPGKVGSRPLRETGNNGPILNINNRGTTSTSQQQQLQQQQLQQQQAIADAVLIKKNADLTKKSNELEQAVIEIEKERDFYFEKLRNVEVMLQIYQEKDNTNRDSDILIDNIFKILYATAEDNLVVNDDGDAVAATDITLLNETGISTTHVDDDDHHHHDNDNTKSTANNDEVGIKAISSGDGEMLDSLLASQDSVDDDNLLTA